jgi:glutamyl-Q tRNA(Asp) synthetase
MPMSDARQPTFRFAPSPTGYLHLGHAYSALLNAELARRHDGRLLLRIEDIDTGRARPEFALAIEEDLAWLGLTWEGPVVRQSDRFERYTTAAEHLEQRGLLYACAATRRDIADALATGSAPPARDPDGAPLYRPICGGDRSVSNRLNRRCLKTQGPFAKRLDMALAVAAALAVNPAPFAFTAWDGRDALSQQPAEPSQWGDAVIVRKDTPASYHLACVVDDAAQGITHIVRGADIAPSTGLHVLLQRLLDLPSPVYHHHDLLLGSDGEKLSKGNAAPSLRQMRADGATPETIREMVGVPNACA